MLQNISVHLRKKTVDQTGEVQLSITGKWGGRNGRRGGPTDILTSQKEKLRDSGLTISKRIKSEMCSETLPLTE